MASMKGIYDVLEENTKQKKEDNQYEKAKSILNISFTMYISSLPKNSSVRPYMIIAFIISSFVLQSYAYHKSLWGMPSIVLELFYDAIYDQFPSFLRNSALLKTLYSFPLHITSVGNSLDLCSLVPLLQIHIPRSFFSSSSCSYSSICFLCFECSVWFLSLFFEF